MFGIIKNFIEDLLALIFSGSILMFGISETYFLFKKEALQKVYQGGPSLSKITKGLTCKRFDEKMNLVKLSTGDCVKKNNKKKQ